MLEPQHWLIAAGDTHQSLDGHDLYLDAHYDPDRLRVMLRIVDGAGLDWRHVMQFELHVTEFILDEVTAVITYYDDGDIRTHRGVLSRVQLTALRATPWPDMSDEPRFA